MGLESGTYIGDLDAANPVGATDKRHQGDDHLRLIKSVLKATFPNATKPFRFPAIVSKTANYTILSSDANAVVLGDTSAGGFNLTLPTLASGDAGWEVRISKTTTDTNALTVVGTINGEANMTLNNRYEILDLIWTGSIWIGVVDPNGLRVATITGDLTVTEDYLDGIILSTPATSNRTITLPAVANYRGRTLSIHHTGNTLTTIIDGNGAETVNGSATLTLNATNQAVMLVAMATGWVVIAQGGGSVATNAEVITGTDNVKTVTPAALAPLMLKGSDIASAGTITIPDTGYVFHVTGTTTITDIDLTTTPAGGRPFVLVFDGALTLTHNATTLILPGGANITTAAGDTAEFFSEGGDNIRCINYTKANGQPVVGSSKTLINTLTPSAVSSIDLTSGILSSYNDLIVEFEGVSSTIGGFRLSVAVSANGGSSFGTAVNLTTAITNNADTVAGTARLSSIQQSALSTTLGVLVTPCSGGTTGGDFITTAAAKPATTGPINALRFSLNSGNFDGSSTIRIYGAS